MSATPKRRKVSVLNQPTTSPYFDQAGKHKSGTDRKRRRSGEDQSTSGSTPARVAAPQDEKRLTTSPYFPNIKSPPLWYVAPHYDTQVQPREQEVNPLPRKRKRLALRGDTPEESPPPPATPKELSQSLQRVKSCLVQGETVRDDPWKIIVATTLLNKTSGKVAIPVFWKLIEEWPTPLSLAQAAAPSLTGLLRPLGTQSVRTSRLIRLSNAYVMHPPVLPSADEGKSTRVLSPASDQEFDQRLTQRSSRQASSAANVSAFPEQTDNIPARPHASSLISPPAPTLAHAAGSIQSPKEYNKAQKSSPIAHIPFTGPYAIDSFRIFSSNIQGGGAPRRVGDQLERMAALSRSVRRPQADDFDETPQWYDPEALRVLGDEDAEWRQVRPVDKELRRYLVWRWAIEGVAYDAERQTFEPADWSFLNRLIRG